MWKLIPPEELIEVLVESEDDLVEGRETAAETAAAMTLVFPGLMKGKERLRKWG